MNQIKGPVVLIKNTSHLRKILILLGLFIQLLGPFSEAQSTSASSTTATAVAAGPQGTLSESASAMKPSSVLSVSYWGVVNFNSPRSDELARKQYNSTDIKTFNYGYLSLNYKLNSLEKFSVSTPYIYQTISANESKAFGLDAYLSYSNSSLFEFDNSRITGTFRLYLPTSQYAYDAKIIAGVRTAFAYKFKVGAWKMNYSFKPDFFLSELTEYRDSTRPGKLMDSPKIIKLEHYIEGERALSSLFSIVPYLGFEESWKKAANAKTKSTLSTSLIARLGLDINLSRQFGLSVGLENKTSVTNRATDWVPLAGEDMGMFLITFAEI